MDEKPEIYLDNGATTKVDVRVVEAMIPYFLKYYGNASSLHHKGAEARNALNDARQVIDDRINADNDEIVFTSGGSESDNLAIRGTSHALKDKGNHIITTTIEHPAVLETYKQLGKEGFEVTVLNVDNDGMLDLDKLRSAIKDNTVLVSIMHANNEVGVVQDLEKIGEICAEKNIVFHSDCVQSLCKVPINVKQMNLSLAAFASHKLPGPKGVGALFVKRGTKLYRQIYGGSHELGLRAGTENIPGIVGFATAVSLWTDDDVERITSLRDKLMTGLLEINDTELNGSRESRLCNNVNISFNFIEGEGILLHLDKNGICASTGSACSSQSLDPSHVLLAINIPHSKAHGAIRFTLSRETKEEEVDYVLKVMPNIVNELRGLSPIKNNEDLAEAEKMKFDDHH